MRPSCVGLGHKSTYYKERRAEGTREESPCEDRVRDGREAATSLDAWSPWELGEAGGNFSWSTQKEHGPDTP